MKVVILNRRKLAIILIVIGLMMMLVGLEKKFDYKLKYTLFIQNDISSLKSYYALDNTIGYKLPTEWSTKLMKFNGDEIIYHNDFNSRDSKIHGFVQVWNLKTSLKSFIETSKNIAGKYNIYKNYKVSQYKQGDLDGYYVQYTMKTSDDVYYNAYEYFLQDDMKLIRFAFYVDENDTKEYMSTMFNTIVNTLKVKK